MNKKYIFTIAVILAIATLSNCSNQADQKYLKQVALFVSSTPYPEFLETVSTKKKSLDTEGARAYLFEIFNHYMPAYWTGTEWDFNGVTRKPKEGAIACGYFITNTLTDIGLDIQRVKLAQAPSSEMIKQLCVNIKHFADFEKLKSHLLAQPDNSLYIVGLDFHTGYMLKTGDEIYFLHSNYIQKQGVMKEVAANSQALTSSKSFMIGSLTANDDLMEKWVKG